MNRHREDEVWMYYALNLAAKGKGATSPNPMVGCVIVKDDRLVAEGWHTRCGEDHAEIAALNRADGSLKGAKMFVSLEPCFHYGRTPPCVDQIIQSGIKEVIIAMTDPNPLTHGKSIRKLQQAGIKVKTGVLGSEARRLNEVFIKYITKHMPFVATKTAESLDGKIAGSTGKSKWITSAKTRGFARKIRGEYDAILVGINTVLRDNPRLNAVKPRKRFRKIILDSRLRIKLTARLFKGVNPANCIVAVTKHAPDAKVKFFRDRGIDVFVCPALKGYVDIVWLFKELANREIASILIEGGGHVIGEALKRDLVDKMYFYIAPRIMGDAKALSSIVGLSIPAVANMISLKDINITKINSDILVTGYVHRHR